MVVIFELENRLYNLISLIKKIGFQKRGYIWSNFCFSNRWLSA